MLFATVASLFLSVALAQGDWGAPLSKPAIHPNLDFIEDGLQRYLPEITFTLKRWNDNRIPQESVNQRAMNNFMHSVLTLSRVKMQDSRG